MHSQYNIFPEQASTFAAEVDLFYFGLVGISVFFTALIFLLVFVFALKYRRRSENECGQAVHGGLLLELLWTGIPLVLVMLIFAWGAKLYFNAYRMPSDAMEIYVTGKQWMWKVQHPNGKREINSLHVPKGQAIKLTIASEDVIHSFFVPAFRNKRDAVPGMFTDMWFEPTKTGEFHLFCAEYCGTDHARMVGKVRVLEPAEYQRWLETGDDLGPTLVSALPGGGGSMAQQGEALFGRLGCVACHAADSGSRGPNLQGRFGTEVELADGSRVVADENYIRESILNPQAKIVANFLPIMPTFQGQIDEDGLAQIVAYIKSLGGKDGETRTEQ